MANEGADEITAIVREIRERVRARYPDGAASAELKIPLPDLSALARARDRAESKVASIGMVNPRPGGALNALVQAVKRAVARALDWHVREQVEFNRQAMSCVEALIEALNENNRTLVALAARVHDAEREARELKDIRSHWAQWRLDWERKLFVNETQFLRSVADLQGAFQHRSTLMESNFRDVVKAQHADYLGALDRSAADLHARFWGEVEKARLEYERMIHEELRIIRQRAAPAHPVSPPAESSFDAGKFSERFRGPESYVRKNVEAYRGDFAGRTRVLDLGCGRGEFLETIPGSRGIDLSEECVAACRAKGLDAEQADLFGYLRDLADGSLDGIFCSQVVEHLSPAELPELVRLAAAKLAPGGLIVVETPNPECLAIFASHFYLDPTHTRPVPAALLAFYLEEFGFGQVRVRKLTPAVESMPALRSLPEDFREAFFGGLDYAASGIRL
ncbi:MAG: class I SAM-dependent methyltransferase [Bryobacteraceae bacterium]